MEASEKCFLAFLGYKINKIEFNINNSYKKGKETIAVEPNFDFEIFYTDKVGVVNINCDIFNKEDKPFHLFISLEAGFGIKKVPEENIVEILRCNAVAIVLPYLRAAISSITSTANINQLRLPLINVGELTKDVEVKKLSLKE